MRALVVGAGVVGQVYGRHLSLGGAEVTFLVKAKRFEETRGGLALYPLNRPRGERAEPEAFTDYRVLASDEDVGREAWDEVYLAMSSTALRGADWFESLARGVGDATIVVLQPGLEDREFVQRFVPAERVVHGIITLIGYPAPLPGETRFPEPGVAYWFPPLVASPMSGPAERLGRAVEALRRGGLPARKADDVAGRTPFGAALGMPLIAGLERAGWRFDDFRRREQLDLALRAAHEAMAIVAHRRGESPPVALRLAARRVPVRALLRVGPRLVPFDLETYLRVHFTKVGDQTEDFLQTFREWGRRAGLPTGGLERVSG